MRGMRVEDMRANPILNGNVKAGDLRRSPRAAAASRSARGSPRRSAPSRAAEISLISPEGRSTVVGTVPRIVSYTVGAVFEVGVYDYDKAFVVMPMEDAQTLLMLGDEVGMVEVQIDRSRQGRAKSSPRCSRWSAARGIIVDWRQMNSALFEALEIERIAMFVVLSLIILVAVFNILSSLIMLVRAKTRDIAILRTMGASRAAMMKMFVTVGVTIGSLGIVLGADPRRDLPVLPPGRGQLRSSS